MITDGRMLARVMAVIAFAVAVTAAAAYLARDSGSPDTPAAPPSVMETPTINPLRETLRRCRQLGEVATSYADCLAAWDENRRRFLSPAGGS